MLSATGYLYNVNLGVQGASATYVDLVSAFAPYSGVNQAPVTGYKVLSGGIQHDLNDLFDRSNVISDQIANPTDFAVNTTPNVGIGGNDLKNIFRNLYSTPTPTPTPPPTHSPTPTPTPTNTPPVTVTPTHTPTLTPPISQSSTPGSSPTPTPSYIPTSPPAPQPSPTPTPTHGTVASVSVTTPGVFDGINLFPSIITNGTSLTISSEAFSNLQVSSFAIQARSGSTNPPTGGGYVTIASISPNATNPVITTTWSPDSGPGYYQFIAYAVVNGTTYYSSDSSVIQVINNQVTVDISTSPASFSGGGPFTVNLTSNANSNWGNVVLNIHGIQRSTDQATWTDVTGSPIYPNTVNNTLTLTDGGLGANTYYYRAYTSNTTNDTVYSSMATVGAVQSYAATPINGNNGLFTSINGDGTGNPVNLPAGTYSLNAQPLGGYYVVGYQVNSGACVINGSLVTAGNQISVNTTQGSLDNSTITISQDVVITSLFDIITVVVGPGGGSGGGGSGGGGSGGGGGGGGYGPVIIIDPGFYIGSGDPTFSNSPPVDYSLPENSTVPEGKVIIGNPVLAGSPLTLQGTLEELNSNVQTNIDDQIGGFVQGLTDALTDLTNNSGININQTYSNPIVQSIANSIVDQTTAAQQSLDASTQSATDSIFASLDANVDAQSQAITDSIANSTAVPQGEVDASGAYISPDTGLIYPQTTNDSTNAGADAGGSDGIMGNGDGGGLDGGGFLGGDDSGNSDVFG